MNKETKIQRLIMLALSEANCMVFRNETGQFWTGKILHKAGDQVTLGNARPIPCGLCVGSSDLIGLTSKGQFFAIEVKTSTGRPTKQQLTFISAIKEKGGLAGIARTTEEAINIINGVVND